MDSLLKLYYAILSKYVFVKGSIENKALYLVVSTHLKSVRQIESFPQGSGWK